MSRLTAFVRSRRTLFHRRVLPFLRRWRKPPPFVVKGEFGQFRLALHPAELISNYIRKHGGWAPEETALLSRLLEPGQVFYDVGANLGWHTVALARVVGRGGAIYSFEPDRENFRLLRRNRRLNRIRTARLYNIAVSDTDGEDIIYRNKTNFGDHRIGGGEDHQASGSVKKFTLETMIRRHRLRPPDLIKIDTQGSEARILSGLPFLLSLNPRLKLFIEFWPFGLRSTHSSAERLIRTLEASRLSLYVASDPPVPISADDLRQRAAKWEDRHAYHENIIALPADFALPGTGKV